MKRVGNTGVFLLLILLVLSINYTNTENKIESNTKPETGIRLKYILKSIQMLFSAMGLARTVQ